jgi:hypothetical protein
MSSLKIKSLEGNEMENNIICEKKIAGNISVIASTKRNMLSTSSTQTLYKLSSKKK